MGARVYDPYTGTFTQPDPIQGGGANAYGYTNADPVNETDLGGKSAGSPEPLCGAGMSGSVAWRECHRGVGPGLNWGVVAEVAADLGAAAACAGSAGVGCPEAIAGATAVNAAVDAASGHPADVAVDIAVGWFGESTIELGIKLMEEQGATKAVQIVHKLMVGGITSFYEAEKLRKHE